MRPASLFALAVILSFGLHLTADAAISHNSSCSNFSTLNGSVECNKCDTCPGKCIKQHANSCLCEEKLKPALADSPAPAPDSSLQQIPGDVYQTPSDCLQQKGKVIRQYNKQFCQPPKRMKAEISRDFHNPPKSKTRGNTEKHPKIGPVNII